VVLPLEVAVNERVDESVLDAVDDADEVPVEVPEALNVVDREVVPELVALTKIVLVGVVVTELDPVTDADVEALLDIDVVALPLSVLLADDVAELVSELEADVLAELLAELLAVALCEDVCELVTDEEPVVVMVLDADVVADDVADDVSVLDGDVTSQPKNVPCSCASTSSFNADANAAATVWFSSTTKKEF
jgi:hypothetical protein